MENEKTNDKLKTCFIAGKAIGDPNYKEKFEDAAKIIESTGRYVAINPATLPVDALGPEKFCKLDISMLEACDAICFLPDFTESKTVRKEFSIACAAGLECMFLTALQQEQFAEAAKE